MTGQCAKFGCTEILKDIRPTPNPIIEAGAGGRQHTFLSPSTNDQRYPENPDIVILAAED